MSPSPKLTDEEKQNGKRKFLTPLASTLEESEMHPITRDDFTRLVKKAIPPDAQHAPAAK
jgi:hypothetical protein